MFTIIILLALLVVFDMIALRWSVDSTEGITSREWDRRWGWHNEIFRDVSKSGTLASRH
jgi:hypothetical protein